MKRALVVALLAPTLSALGQTCQPAWDQGFRYSKLDGTINSTAVFDDGTGPAVYVFGPFSSYDGMPLAGIGKWNGTTFEPFGATFTGGNPTSGVVLDEDGAGPIPPALYISGTFTGVGSVSAPSLVRWDGTTFTPVLPSGMTLRGGLTVHNDGSGPRLYFAARLSSVGDSVVRLNNGNAEVVGTATFGSTPGSVPVLRSWDDGQGPALYAGGNFSHMQQVPAAHLAVYRAGVWSAVPGLPSNSGSNVQNLCAVNLPETGGPCLIVAGQFTSAGSTDAACIAKYQEGVWSTFGMTSTTGWRTMSMLDLVDTGDGPKLYGGLNTGLCRLDASGWTLIGSDAFNTRSVVAEPGTNRLLLTGGFTRVSTIPVPGFAAYENGSWTQLGGMEQGLSGTVRAMVKADLGSGEKLYVAGQLDQFGGYNQVAVWNGASWSVVGPPLPTEGMPVPSIPLCMGVHDDGTGRALYVGSNAGVYRLVNNAWALVGTSSGTCNGLTTFDFDGNGPNPPELVACGALRVSDATQPVVAARWNGVSWLRVGNASTTVAITPIAYAVASFDSDGAGPQGAELYMAGQSLTGGGPNIAVMKLAGATWSPQLQLSSGRSAGCFTVFNNGSGDTLYVGGALETTIARTVYMLTPSGFVPAHSNTLSPSNPFNDVSVRTMVPIIDQDGPGLVVFGNFNTSGAAMLRNGVLSPWNFTHNTFGFARPNTAYAALTFDDGSGQALWLGGSFTSVSNGTQQIGSTNIARLRLCDRITSCDADFNQDGDTGTDQDIEAFFACLGGTCCTRCLSADFNADGDTGTDQDIESFFRVLGGNGC